MRLKNLLRRLRHGRLNLEVIADPDSASMGDLHSRLRECGANVARALADEERLSRLCAGGDCDATRLEQWRDARQKVDTASRQLDEAMGLCRTLISR